LGDLMQAGRERVLFRKQGVRKTNEKPLESERWRIGIFHTTVERRGPKKADRERLADIQSSLDELHELGTKS